MRVTHDVLLGVLLLAATAAIAHARPALVLVRDGQPRATIVLGREPRRAAQFAASELQWHLEQISGARVPIVSEADPASGVRIYVGESDATQRIGLGQRDLGQQEYAIRFLPHALVLVGRDDDDRGKVEYSQWPSPEAIATWPDMWKPMGTMYAVYDFLERCCNVRWFNPSELGMDCPKRSTLSVSGPDVRRRPLLRYRYACYLLSENYDRFTALAPRTDDEWKEYDAAHYPKLRAQLPDWWQWVHAKRGYVQLFRYRMRDGGELTPGNHSLYGYYDRFWEKNPQAPDVFEGQHADWFAQGYEGRPPQMCYTSRGLIEQVSKDAREFFDTGKKHPGAQAAGDFFCVEPMDNASFCKCAACQELISRTRREQPSGVFSRALDSDYFFHFVNEVAKEVRKTHPDKWIVTLAYMTHAYPPASFRLEPNVTVQFCFASNRMPYAQQEYEGELRALREWAKQADERPMYLWLYYTFPVEIAVNGRFHCFPGYFAHKIGEQMKLFAKHGFRGMFHCGYGQEVEAYVTYKLMDDPSLNVDRLLGEYFRRYYGAAAEPMERMYLDIERTYCDPANWPDHPGHMTVDIAWGRLGTPERMGRYAEWMEEAKRLARTDLEKQRVALFEQDTWQYMKQGYDQFEARTTASIPSANAPKVADAGGDVAKVDWARAAALEGGFRVRGGDAPSPRKLEGRVAHDSRYLYLELTDPCDTSKLVVSPDVYPFDTWEIFVAAQRAKPYRQFAVGPSGSVAATTNGEGDGGSNVALPSPGIRATSDTSAADRWVTRLAIPLATLTPAGVAPGGKVYLNVVRVSSPGVNGTGGLDIDSWVSYATVHTVDRLAEIALE
jgi:Domain of unknown function (DUF4838)